MINERMKKAEEMTKEINANRELYRYFVFVQIYKIYLF